MGINDMFGDILSQLANKSNDLTEKLGNIIDEETNNNANPNAKQKTDLEIIQEVADKYDFPSEPQA